MTAQRSSSWTATSHTGPHKQDTSTAHGEPLGEEEIRLTKRAYGWPADARFLVPDEVREHVRSGLGARGAARREAWMDLFAAYARRHPDLADDIQRMQHRVLPADWDRGLPVFPADAKGIAGREASSRVLNAIAANVPWLVGGSADLTPSTKTAIAIPGAGDFQADTPSGRNLHFGVREHAMGAILNGLSLSKIRPYGSGFLIFSDYGRPSLRLSALMELPVIYIFTHDSIGVGEDGPTHQPVEQLASLRAIPGLITLRPADANEIVEAWRIIMPLRHQPVALVLSRQPLPTIDRTQFAPAAGVARGAYVLADAPGGRPDVLLLATGSEVALRLETRAQLAREGLHARVVSMPSWELFEQQTPEYRQEVLTPAVKARVAVEQASTFGWERYVGAEGAIVGMHTFGASAPLKALQQKYGFTPERLVEEARAQVARAGAQNRAGRS
jgi:transketolase